MTKKEMQEKMDKMQDRINALITESAIHRAKRGELERERNNIQSTHGFATQAWRDREEELVNDLDSSKTVLRTLTIERWGDKADTHLKYAVYGDGGGGVPGKDERASV